MKRRTFLILLGLSVPSISAIYLTPTFLTPESKLFPVVASIDGAFYSYRLKGALEGDSVLSCVETPSLRTPKTWMPAGEDRLWAKLIRPFIGTNIFSALHLTYAALPALLFLILSFGVLMLTKNYALALIVPFWGMISSSVYAWKPFRIPGTPVPEWWDHLTFFRFANPMLRSVSTAIALGMLFRLFQKTESRIQIKPQEWILTSFILFLPFFSQVYYWSWILATLGCFALSSQLRKQHSTARAAFMTGILALALGIPALIQSLGQAKDALTLEVLHRVGLLIQLNQPHFLFHKGILGMFFFYQIVCWKSRDWQWRFFSVGIICGYILLNQNFITGVYNQEHHYFRPLTLLYIFLCADIARRISLRVSISTRITCIVLLFMGAVGFLNARKIAHAAKLPGHFVQLATEIPQTLRQLNNIPSLQKGEILADPKLSYILGIHSSIPTYVHEYTLQCMISNQEFFDRWSLLRFFSGWSPARYREFIFKQFGEDQLNWWLWGLPTSYSGRRDRNTLADLKEMAGACADAYDKIRPIELVSRLKSGHGLPQLALSSPGFELDLVEMKKHFALELLFENREEKTALWGLQAL